jgi:transposase
VAQELVEMSSKELDRLAVVRQVLEGRLTQAKAGEFIGLSERQVRRLCAAFDERGPAGLVSGKRGQPSNRRLPEELRSQAVEIVRERYADFGPTLACEKLLELHDLRVSVRSESAFDYFASSRAYLERHGKPVAFYSDKHSIFRVNHEGSTGRAGGVTQFGRALTELNIDIICANSPQAKGRVERMNKTLQDRLVKELRLRGISTMETGNAFLPQFMADYNRRFGRTAKNAHDAHRPLRGDEDLSRIFSWQEERRMSRNLVVHFKRITYLVEPGPETLRFAGKRVRVFEWEDGRVEIRCEGQLLPYSPFDKNRCVDQGAVVENKRLGAVLSVIQASQVERDKVRLASKKLTLREKERIEAAQEAAGLSPPSSPEGLSEVSSFLERYEAEQKARRKVRNDRAALRRKAQVAAPQQRRSG